jgi:hypothetical protein
MANGNKKQGVEAPLARSRCATNRLVPFHTGASACGDVGGGGQKEDTSSISAERSASYITHHRDGVAIFAHIGTMEIHGDIHPTQAL